MPSLAFEHDAAKAPRHSASYGVAAKRIALFLALVGTVVPSYAGACKNTTIEKAVNLLANAYAAKRMESLDCIGIKGEEVQFVIEHSLTFDYEVEEAKTFSQAEQWLRNLEIEKDMPTREVRSLDWCRKGLCVFNFEEGISHNTLYIHKVIYGYKNGCPSLRTVFLLNGD